VAGAESAAAFRTVTEAYEVLADPVTRRRHNSELAREEERSPRARVATPVAPWRPAPVSPQAEPWAVRASIEALVDRLVRDVTGLGVPKAERPEGLTFEVILTPDEALRGVEVPLGVPGVRPTPWVRITHSMGRRYPCSGGTSPRRSLRPSGTRPWCS
jgi:hypothetical protein